MQTRDTIIIGAGQSGLAVGYYLQRQEIDFVILEANPQVGGSWQHYWDNLQLFSTAKYSQLPGMNFPGHPQHYPTRDEVIDYLQDYAAHFNMDVRTNTPVKSIHREDGVFCVQTTTGQTFAGHTVVAASGPFTRPYIPDIPGYQDYQGHTLHSIEYTDATPFKGERVVVVGANNSAVQIGYELSAVADVTLAVRRKIAWWPKWFLGRNIFFWFHDTGFDMLPLGLFFDLKDSKMVLDDGTLRRAVKDGKPDTRQMFTTFTPDGVRWADGQTEKVDTVLFATGFRRDNMPYLEPLGALGDDGRPMQRGGVSKAVSGLFFVGVFGQRAPASATLRGVGADAKKVSKKIRKYLGRFVHSVYNF